MATRSKLEDLDLTTEEVERLSKAFKDEKFRELFQAYAEEISNPENKKKYEEEITLMEKERGMDVKFVHPQPGHVLKTSFNGVQKCYINICSNELISKPSCEVGEGKGNRKGQHWSLPYSLAPGREDLGKEGSKHMIYDVVFHPETLYIASKNQKFKQMVDSTAMEAVEKQFGVKLDEKNGKVLKLKYKGVPQAAVLRTPLHGKPQQTVDADEPLRFPYPYETDLSGINTERRERGQTEAEKHATVPYQTDEDRALTRAKSTTPRYTIVHRSHFDLQDYRYSRDATPSPVPKELVITVDLPLLKSAEQATLDVTEKHLSLESGKPDYSLQISLPYRVDENQGTAKFNKAKKQLVITLPVVPQMYHTALTMSRDQKLVLDAPKNDGVHDDPLENEPADGAGSEVMWQVEAMSLNSEEDAQSRCLLAAESQISVIEKMQNRPWSSERKPAKDKPEEAVGQKETTVKIQERTESDSTHFSNNFSKDLQKSNEATTVSSQEGFSAQPSLQTNELVPPTGKKDGPQCPTFQCSQDDLSVRLVLHVLNIEKESLKEDVSANQYSISFCSRDNITYYLIIQFPPHNKLNTEGTAVSISRINAVIELSKSSESTGPWKKLYFGLNSDSLQKKLFVSEENVDEFLEDALHSVDMKQSIAGTQPLIEVLKVTDIQSHIRLKERKSSQCDQKEEGANIMDTSEILDGVSPQMEPAVTTTDIATREHTIEDDEAFTLVAPGSDCCLQPELSNGRLPLAEECWVSEPECDSAATRDTSAASINSKRETFPQHGEGADRNELDEDDAPIKQQDGNSSKVLTSGAVMPAIKEINAQDGSVQVITDHTTHCPFTFQNSVLYDLD